jgi:hypothetical protein
MASIRRLRVLRAGLVVCGAREVIARCPFRGAGEFRLLAARKTRVTRFEIVARNFSKPSLIERRVSRSAVEGSKVSSVAMLRWMTGAVAFWLTALGMVCVPEMFAERRYRL